MIYTKTIKGVGKISFDTTPEETEVRLSGAIFGMPGHHVTKVLKFEDGKAEGDGAEITYPKLADLTAEQIREIFSYGVDIDPITPFHSAVFFGTITKANGKEIEWKGW